MPWDRACSALVVSSQGNCGTATEALLYGQSDRQDFTAVPRARVVVHEYVVYVSRTCTGCAERGGVGQDFQELSPHGQDLKQDSQELSPHGQDSKQDRMTQVCGLVPPSRAGGGTLRAQDLGRCSAGIINCAVMMVQQAKIAVPSIMSSFVTSAVCTMLGSADVCHIRKVIRYVTLLVYFSVRLSVCVSQVCSELQVRVSSDQLTSSLIQQAALNERFAAVTSGARCVA